MIWFITSCVCVIITLFIPIYLYFTRNFSCWRNQNVPYKKPVFFFGNTLPLVLQKMSINAFLRDLYKSATFPCVGFFFFDRPLLLIRDPELIKRILVSEFDYFEDRSVMYNEHDKYIRTNLFMLKQPAWRNLRTKVTSVFTASKLKNMVPLVLEAGDDMVNFMKLNCLGSEMTNCRSTTFKYAIDAISSCAFGLRVNSHENSDFAEAAKGIQGVTPLRVIQMAAHFFAPLLVKIFRLKFNDPKSCRYLAKIFLDTVKQREQLKTNRPDFIELMKKLQREEPDHFDDELLASLPLQFLVAGFETSGATIAYILYELSLNTSIQDRLRAEILAVLSKHETITYDAIQEMPYLDMVIKEALRKYPTLPFLDRECTKAYTIPNTNVVIQKGVAVYISLTALQHDENYFPDPMVFNPERFSTENKSTIVPCTYMPFGEGYRNCLATKFGYLSVSIGVIKILSHFEIVPSKYAPKELTYENGGFLLIPTNDQVLVKFRSLNT
uniref:Cytochrome P450 n=2 Tax=Photinus pyralis TaxID=7054 RepID=A0A1Y1LZR7_PHOPY